MVRPLLALLLSVIVFTAPAHACMNDYSPNVEAIQRSQSVLDQLQKHIEREPWTARRDRLRKKLAAGSDYKVKNDLATSLAHTGEALEAVTLLEQIEAEKPGLYATASNLGTAYELAGDDEKALEWIRKGIERNPNAHERTEWLHVRILEAKLALKKDPTWLESNSVLGPRTQMDMISYFAGTHVTSIHTDQTMLVGPSASLDFSITGNRGEKLSPEEIEKALMYQLHERLQFVQPPNAIVGDLLVELGHLVAHQPPGLGGAKGVFKMANTYLYKMPDVMALQEDALKQERFAGEKQKILHPEWRERRLYILSISAVLLPLLVISLKRWIERRLIGKSAPVAA